MDASDPTSEASSETSGNETAKAEAPDASSAKDEPAKSDESAAGYKFGVPAERDLKESDEQGPKKQESAKDESAKDESAKEETAKEEKDEAPKDQSPKDETSARSTVTTPVSTDNGAGEKEESAKAEKPLAAPAAPQGESKEKAAGAESSTEAEKVQAHHVSKILDEVLVESAQAAEAQESYKHPMYLDLVLAFGLLIAMGGFTIGLAKLYITHSAQQSIMQHNYRAAIAILKGSPFPGFFNMPGSDPEDLLNQALYLDAMEQLDANGEDPAALKELGKIQAGSRYFELAQEILKEHFRPSSIQLQGTAEHRATPEETRVERRPPILPEPEREGSP